MFKRMFESLPFPPQTQAPNPSKHQNRKLVPILIVFSSVQSLSCAWLFSTPWNAARQASLSITNSRSLLKLMSIELTVPSNHLILCHSFLLPPSAFPSIRVFSNESALHIRWPKYWSFRFSIIPSKECSGLSLPWGSFHKPFTLLHQRVDRMETTITEN